MQTVTTDTVPGQEIVESLGLVRGNTVEARNIGRDITQSLRNITGGELKGYSELLTRARDEALSRMEAHAEEMGADAVVNVRLETSEIIDGGAEVIAYGTAVRLG
ncbi:MAG: YbjQ family protein [Salinarchaeum sp.]